MAEKKAKPKPAQYMVGDSAKSCDWRGPFDSGARWRMSSKDGVRWDDDGPLDEGGRELILEHFGLQRVAHTLPLAKLVRMSPARLAKKRHDLEERNPALPKMALLSTRMGGHIPAALAA